MVIIGTFAMSATALTLQLNQSSIITQDRLTATSLAWNKWNEISAKSYEEVTAEARKQSSSNAFDVETSVGDEQTFSDSTTGKNVIISVFKKDDANPAFSLTATKIKSSASGGVPVGTILPWYGNISNIPDGFALCNGSNGTPDLRDRFLVGAGDSYSFASTGGSKFTTIANANLPSTGLSAINGGFFCGEQSRRVHGQSGTVVESLLWGYLTSNKVQRSYLGSSTEGNFYNWDSFQNALSSAGWNSEPLEISPPYFTIYYIIKK